jgi:hypothetical protein
MRNHGKCLRIAVLRRKGFFMVLVSVGFDASRGRSTSEYPASVSPLAGDGQSVSSRQALSKES